MAKKNKENKTRKISKKKIIIAVILILIVIGLITAAFFLLNKEETKEGKTIKIENVDTIEGYDYTLNSNATEYYKELFKELKTVLEEEEIDESKYADSITKLFVADFYNLENKINKNDIGGTEFVYNPFREDFQKLATNSMYKSVENNVYGDREQALPKVTNVSTESAKTESFKYGDKTDSEAYIINFDITYAEDLGYQTSGTLTLIHNENKLEVAALS